MAQPKDPPLSIRPGAARLERIDAEAARENASRHAMIMTLLDEALDGREGGGAPAVPSPGGPKPPLSVGARSRTAVVQPQVRGVRADFTKKKRFVGYHPATGEELFRED